MRTPRERAIKRWERYVASIPHAIAMFAAAEPKPSDEAVVKYGLGLRRYARILEREIRARHTPKR